MTMIVAATIIGVCILIAGHNKIKAARKLAEDERMLIHVRTNHAPTRDFNVPL